MCTAKQFQQILIECVKLHHQIVACDPKRIVHFVDEQNPTEQKSWDSSEKRKNDFMIIFMWHVLLQIIVISN